jgi:hypothetical protein
LENYKLIGDGEGIHWPDLDEDISIKGILAGRRSGESQNSLEKWLKKKNTRVKNPPASQMDSLLFTSICIHNSY